MKTHKFFYALAATAMLGLSACSSEEPLLQGGNGEGNPPHLLSSYLIDLSNNN